MVMFRSLVSSSDQGTNQGTDQANQDGPWTEHHWEIVNSE